MDQREKDLKNAKKIAKSFRPYEQSLFVLGKKPDVLSKLIDSKRYPKVTAKAIKAAIIDIADVELSSDRRIFSDHEAINSKRSNACLDTVQAEMFVENLVSIAELIQRAEDEMISVKDLYSSLRRDVIDKEPDRSIVNEKGPIATIDVGGTGIKYALYDQVSHKFLHNGETETPQSTMSKKKDRETFISVICDIITLLCEKHGIGISDLAGAGILVPASVELGSGRIKWLPFLDIKDLDLKSELLNRIGVTASIGPDVTLETLGAAKELDLKGKLKGTILGVSAGTSIGLGVITRTDDGFRILSTPDMGFNIELIRGYSVGQSIGVYIPTPDHHLGWKVAARGIVNTVAQRLKEVSQTKILESRTLKELKEMSDKDPRSVYEIVLSASEHGDLLARRLIIEAFDTDSGYNYKDDLLMEYVSKRAVAAIEKATLSNLSNTDISSVTPKLVNDLAKDGDVLAQDILREAGYFLGASLSIILPFIKPQTVYLFGGLSKSSIWRQSVESTIRKSSDFKGKFIRKGETTHFLGAATLVQLDLNFHSGSIVV